MGRSRGGRSPHAEQAGQLRRPSTPHLLVQQDAVGVQPSLHSDLADEDEHVERAGLVQVDHDGAVHDRTGTNTCQQLACCMCWTAPCCAIAEHHHAVGQQAHDEQQQQRDGRREGCTHHGRAHALAPPPRATRAPRPTGVAIARKVVSNVVRVKPGKSEKREREGERRRETQRTAHSRL